MSKFNIHNWQLNITITVRPTFFFFFERKKKGKKKMNYNRNYWRTQAAKHQVKIWGHGHLNPGFKPTSLAELSLLREFLF